jgi:hypothetical protein
MEKENIRPIDIKDFKDSQHTLDYIDNDFAIVNSLEGIPDCLYNCLICRLLTNS